MTAKPGTNLITHLSRIERLQQPELASAQLSRAGRESQLEAIREDVSHQRQACYERLRSFTDAAINLQLALIHVLNPDALRTEIIILGALHELQEVTKVKCTPSVREEFDLKCRILLARLSPGAKISDLKAQRPSQEQMMRSLSRLRDLVLEPLLKIKNAAHELMIAKNLAAEAIPNWTHESGFKELDRLLDRLQQLPSGEALLIQKKLTAIDRQDSLTIFGRLLIQVLEKSASLDRDLEKVTNQRLMTQARANIEALTHSVQQSEREALYSHQAEITILQYFFLRLRTVPDACTSSQNTSEQRRVLEERVLQIGEARRILAIERLKQADLIGDKQEDALQRLITAKRLPARVRRTGPSETSGQELESVGALREIIPGFPGVSKLSKQLSLEQIRDVVEKLERACGGECDQIVKALLRSNPDLFQLYVKDPKGFALYLGQLARARETDPNFIKMIRKCPGAYSRPEKLAKRIESRSGGQEGYPPENIANRTAELAKVCSALTEAGLNAAHTLANLYAFFVKGRFHAGRLRISESMHTKRLENMLDYSGESSALRANFLVLRKLAAIQSCRGLSLNTHMPQSTSEAQAVRGALEFVLSNPPQGGFCPWRDTGEHNSCDE